MSGYTKLFNSILTSTIWSQDSDTKVIWITMLAMADRNGMVEATAPGVAKMAGVSLEKTEQVLDMLSQLDPVSRSLDNDGKRIERVNGGYTLLNYKKYRLRNRSEDRKAYMRKYMRDYMQKRRQAAKVKSVLDSVNQNKPIAEAEAYTYTYISKGGVVEGENNRSINSEVKTEKPNTPIFQSQGLRTQPIKCAMPGCSERAAPGSRFCSPACENYAALIEQKHLRSS